MICSAGAAKEPPVVTPLMEYVRNKRAENATQVSATLRLVNDVFVYGYFDKFEFCMYSAFRTDLIFYEILVTLMPTINHCFYVGQIPCLRLIREKIL